MLVSDDQSSYAMRHRARRAAQLAAVIRRSAEAQELHDVDLSAFAERMGPEGWALVSECVFIETGVPFKAPSEITKQMCIGLLSMPAVEGLITSEYTKRRTS